MEEGKRNIVEIFDSEEAVRVVPREAAVDLLPEQSLENAHFS
jgi:hypothetical protein